MRLLILVFALFSYAVSAQTDISLTTQVYPTGVIPGIQVDHLIGTKEAITFRVGYQLIDHRDLGAHANEEGSGYGFTLGYRKYSNEAASKFYWAVKSDLWFNAIDWYDIGVNDDRILGNTDITVLQPTAEIGYQFLFPSNLFISPSIAFGWEWNIKTDGEPTGQGAILLLGIQFGKRF